MNRSSEWYSSLSQDLWESLFYSEVVAYVENIIFSQEGEANTRKLLALLFEIQKLETILNRGHGIEKLKNSICKIADLLKSWGFKPTEAHRQAMVAVLKKNAIPDAEIENIISCL